MQEKSSEITTNESSTIVPDQTQTEIVNVKGNEETEGKSGNVDPLLVKGGSNDAQLGTDEHEKLGDHEYTGEEFNHEYENFHDEGGKFENQIQGYDPRDFEKFDDFDPSQVPDIDVPPQKISTNPPKEQKPIKNTTNPTQTPLIKKPQPVKQESKPTQDKKQIKKQQKPAKIQKKQETAPKKQQLPSEQPKMKKLDEKKPVPVIASQGKKQIPSEPKKSSEQPKPSEGSGSQNPKKDEMPVASQGTSQSQAQPNQSQVKEVSSIILPPPISAGEIIFEAQMERIGTTLDLFFKFTGKHQKHIRNQKQLIGNIEDQIQKRRISKTPLMNTLRDYFDNFCNLCRDLYERSYKFAKSDKPMSANPMINMREELKGGIDEMIFLRKSTGNEYNRLGEFVATNIVKNVIKLFTEYWTAVCVAQTKQKEKREEFAKKQKQFLKRISKVIKVYTKGKQGSSQEEDLFIEMIKYINQEKQFRTCLIEYGTGLIPLKKAFIKAEETLHEELQVLFNTYKNQFRVLFGIHPKEFIQIQKMEKLIRQNSTFEKLSDITDGDYVRSVLVTLEKGSVQNLTDKEFEKVFNMLHFEEIVGNPVELLKGTTTKAFELKNKAEQVIDTVSGNLLIFNKETAQMKEKFIIKNIDARIVQQGVVQIDETMKGIIFDSHRTVRVTFRDNDRAEELICFLNQVHENIKQQEEANDKKK